MGRRKKALKVVRRRSRDVYGEETTVFLQVGRTLWDNVPKAMRTELWMSMLHRKGLGMAVAEKYDSLLAKGIPATVLETIEKDIGRTFPDVVMFTKKKGQQSMKRVLQAYAAYDPEVGYCQGMNFLAGLLLMYMPSEAYAFAGLVVLLQERGLRDLYNKDMSLLQVRLWQLGRLLPADLLHHLEMTGALPVLFSSSWFLTSFAADFPIPVVARIMDIIMADIYEVIVLKVALTILTTCTREIKAREDMEEIVSFLTNEVPSRKMVHLHELVTEALRVPWTVEQQAILNNTSGVETVHQTVARVEGGVFSPRSSGEKEEEEVAPRSLSKIKEGDEKLYWMIPPVPSWTSRSGGDVTPRSLTSTYASSIKSVRNSAEGPSKSQEGHLMSSNTLGSSSTTFFDALDGLDNENDDEGDWAGSSFQGVTVTQSEQPESVRKDGGGGEGEGEGEGDCVSNNSSDDLWEWVGPEMPRSKLEGNGNDACCGDRGNSLLASALSISNEDYRSRLRAMSSDYAFSGMGGWMDDRHGAGHRRSGRLLGGGGVHVQDSAGSIELKLVNALRLRDAAVDK